MTHPQIAPFGGTPEQKAQLMAAIAACKDIPGSLMTIMQHAQEIYGYLPIQVQTMISDATGHPVEEIYSIATFYSMFNLFPQGRHHISVCMGTTCYVKGARNILNRVSEVLGISGGECTSDGLFSLDVCRCVGACGLAPVLLVDDDVYGHVEVDQIEGILQKYRNL
ncbi:MAG: NAD(P)H-dependent oxidoreductase subunit E [Oscillospiraceae bacterium]|nr:NAD(P)H-dependent oxidoreductase subunit E [Oscillospiraceae bacterium]